MPAAKVDVSLLNGKLKELRRLEPQLHEVQKKAQRSRKKQPKKEYSHVWTRKKKPCDSLPRKHARLKF